MCEPGADSRAPVETLFDAAPGDLLLDVKNRWVYRYLTGYYKVSLRVTIRVTRRGIIRFP